MEVNGKQYNFQKQLTVNELLEELNINLNRVAVEVNFKIIPKEDYNSTLLRDEDSIEIISFMGGG